MAGLGTAYVRSRARVRPAAKIPVALFPSWGGSARASRAYMHHLRKRSLRALGAFCIWPPTFPSTTICGTQSGHQTPGAQSPALHRRLSSGVTLLPWRAQAAMYPASRAHHSLRRETPAASHRIGKEPASRVWRAQTQPGIVWSFAHPPQAAPSRGPVQAAARPGPQE